MTWQFQTDIRFVSVPNLSPTVTGICMNDLTHAGYLLTYRRRRRTDFSIRFVHFLGFILSSLSSLGFMQTFKVIVSWWIKNQWTHMCVHSCSIIWQWMLQQFKTSCPWLLHVMSVIQSGTSRLNVPQSYGRCSRNTRLMQNTGSKFISLYAGLKPGYSFVHFFSIVLRSHSHLNTLQTSWELDDILEIQKTKQ